GRVSLGDFYEKLLEEPAPATIEAAYSRAERAWVTYLHSLRDKELLAPSWRPIHFRYSADRRGTRREVHLPVSAPQKHGANVRIKARCRGQNSPLPAAAIQFPLDHPLLSCRAGSWQLKSSHRIGGAIDSGSRVVRAKDRRPPGSRGEYKLTSRN